MRIHTLLIAATMLAACTNNQPSVKSAETARVQHFESNVHAQQTLAQKQHAERVSLANRQLRERQEAHDKVFTDLAADNAKVDTMTADIAKEHAVFSAETRDRVARLDARAQELYMRGTTEPLSVRRSALPAWLAYQTERRDLDHRITRLGRTSADMWPSAESAIDVHIRMADAALDAVASKLK